MRDNKITSEERKYWIQIPNLIDDLDLSVYAFRLYAHMKRRAGDLGECYESSRNLAKSCNMGEGSVTRAKKELQKAGLIYIKSKRKPGGEYHVITVRDIWFKNMATYGKPECASDEQLPEEQCATGAQKCATGATKNNPLRRQPRKFKNSRTTTTDELCKSGTTRTIEQPRILTLPEKIGELIKGQGRSPNMDAINEAIAMWKSEVEVANKDIPAENKWSFTNRDAILERYDIVTLKVYGYE